MAFFQASPAAVRRLYWYNLLISFTLTIAANFTFIDRLLLRLNIDLGIFGTMKSIMFLLPAVLYQVFSPLLHRLDRDVQVTAICYSLRGLLPLLLPVLAVFCTDKGVLTAASVVLLSGGMLFATFANNSLMKLYRKVIPAEQFNYSVGVMNMLLSLPALIVALPIAWLLDRFDHWDDPAFFLLFAGLQLLTFLFDIPAVLLLLKLKTAPSEIVPDRKQRSGLLPYRDRRFRLILLLIFLHRFGSGLGMAYLTVYFLKVMELSMTTLIVIGILMSVILYSMMPVSGKIMDKWGYGRIFPLLAGGMLTGLVLFCCCWKSVWVLPLFALLMWDSMASLCGGILFQGVYAAAGKLADKNWLDAAVAAFSICSNGGVFAGLLAASGVYALTHAIGDGSLSMTLRLYYIGMIPVFAVIFYITLLFRLKKIM